MTLTGLGDANLAANSLEDAETAFIEALTTSEQMGLVREMLGIMTKVAKIRAAAGRRREAVEMLATVVAEPMSAQPALFETGSISENASAALDELQAEMDPDEFSAAHASGTSRPYDVVAKELIDSLDRRPHTPLG